MMQYFFNSVFNDPIKKIIMQKIILCLFSAILFLASCQNKPTTATDATVIPKPVEVTPPTPAPAAAVTTCYELIEYKKDLTAVELTVAGNAASGYYAYEPNQKDGAHGFFSGTKTGDEITGTYIYMIEGTIQSEEMMFKIADGKLLKANAELKDPKNDGNMVIKDKSKVKWTTSLAAVDCAKVDKAIKKSKDLYAMIQKAQTIEKSKK